MGNQSLLNPTTATSEVPERLVPGTLAWELYEVEHKQRYEWATKYCAGQTVLDVACGIGYGTEILRESGATAVIGVDIEVAAIANGNGRQAMFANADACKLPFADQSFDVVVSFETIEHVKEPELLLREFARVLKRDGSCICSSPNRDFQPYWGHKEVNPFHISEMNYGEFERLFTKYFSISERYSQTHSESYIRHLQLLRELDARLKPIRLSRLLRLEKKIRHWLGRDSLNGLESLPAQLSRGVPGDYTLSPLREPADNLLTFVFVGKVK
jgi:ubiquinone/menaquinone biosynthesis C-methylase UbiE